MTDIRIIRAPLEDLEPGDINTLLLPGLCDSARGDFFNIAQIQSGAEARVAENIRALVNGAVLREPDGDTCDEVSAVILESLDGYIVRSRTVLDGVYPSGAVEMAHLNGAKQYPDLLPNRIFGSVPTIWRDTEGVFWITTFQKEETDVEHQQGFLPR